MFVWRNFKGKERRGGNEKRMGEGAEREGARKEEEKGKRRKKGEREGGRKEGLVSEKQTLEIRNYPRRKGSVLAQERTEEYSKWTIQKNFRI